MFLCPYFFGSWYFAKKPLEVSLSMKEEYIAFEMR